MGEVSRVEEDGAVERLTGTGQGGHRGALVIPFDIDRVFGREGALVS
jgi:hypothetical protein